MRRLSRVDQFLSEIGIGLSSLFGSETHSSQRENPSKNVHSEETISVTEKKHSAGLMRVDHTGEICAQALYRGQAFLAKKPETRDAFLRAAIEEQDHLVWCHERLKELNSHPSYLNVFWYTASFLIGLIASSFGDEWSNGFVVETENQVECHLSSHLLTLPPSDARSRAILEQMKRDEIEHALVAKKRGAKELPFLVKSLMLLQSQAMTRTAYWV